jgi:hypothetical protein
MKTTIDIPEDELKDAIKYAKAKTKRDAILTAVTEFNRRQRMAELIQYSGASDTFMNNAQIEALDGQDWAVLKRKPRRRSRRA